MIDFKLAHKIFNDAVANRYSLAENDAERQWIKLKEKHSLQVLGVGSRILESDDALKKRSIGFHEWAKTALLLHDLGRFYQFKNGSLDKNIDHGALGADILNKDYNVHEPHILFSIKYHDKMEIDAECLDESIWLMLWLVRDADKLANYIMFKNEGVKYMTTAQNKNLKITESAFQSFKQRRLVDWYSIDKPTKFDFVLLLICWQYDIYFKATRQIMEQENINQFLVQELRRIADKIRFDDPSSTTEREYNSLINHIHEIEDDLFSV